MPTITQTAVPCGKCPFRKDVAIYLRRERRIEIAETLLRGGEFHCHGAVEWDEDDDGEDVADTADALRCAGAAKALLAVGCSTQLMRVEERLGLLDLDAAEATGAEVWSLHEWQQLPEGATGDDPEGDGEDDEIETCNTVGPDCIAPAGYAIGGGVTYGPEPADEECATCGEAVCSACIDRDGNCGTCTELDDED